MTEVDPTRDGEREPTLAAEAAGDPGTRIEPGARWGDFTLVRELGRGAQGVVFEAHQESLDRQVAVKILPAEITFTGEQVERFKREAEAAGRLAHPSIVSVHGLMELGGHHAIVQEYVTGGSLEDELEERRWKEERTDATHCEWSASVTARLADALAHAHVHNVIHRDVKPANVLLTETGEPKLTDFGLAKVEDKLGLSRTGALMGTPHYLSPEQVDPARGTLDARTDVYSLGAVLYRMLTHRVPFTAKTAQGVFIDILTRAPASPRKLQPGVNADLEAVCLKALEKSPDDRYADAEAFAADLQRYLHQQPTLARPVSMVGRAVRSMRRLATSSLALTALLVAVAWFAFDLALLAPWAGPSQAGETARLGAIVAATLLVAWPLTVLGGRLSRGRAWAAPAAVVVALGLGALGTRHVLDQRRTSLAEKASEAMVLSITEDRRDLADIEAFVANWGDHLDQDDIAAIAGAYLVRGRPLLARDWTERLARDPDAEALYQALRSATADALGDEATVQDATARLETLADDLSWEDWMRLGFVYDEAGWDNEAHSAFERAARQPDADRDQLNYVLARISFELRDLELADRRLDNYREFKTDTLQSLWLAFRIAAARGHWDEASDALAALEAEPDTPTEMAVRARYELLDVQGLEQEAAAWLASASREHADDDQVVAWCAHEAYGKSTSPARYAVAYRDAGYDDEAARYRDKATPWLDLAGELYGSLTAPERLPLLGQIGLSSVRVQQAELQPERDDELLAEAVACAERAVALDPEYFEGHFNLGLARLKQLKRQHGDIGDFPLDALQIYAGHLRDALRMNGTSIEALNNAAYTLGLIYDDTGDRATLDEALAFARQAVRLLERLWERPEGAPPPSAADRNRLSATLDTLASLHLKTSDYEAALLHATAALDVLHEDDARYAARVQTVNELRELASGQ